MEIKFHHFTPAFVPFGIAFAPYFEKKNIRKARGKFFLIVLFFILYNALYSRVFFMNTALRKTQVVVFKDICGKRSYLILLG